MTEVDGFPARGAGATRCYRLSEAAQLSALAERLSLGSEVSFYFDGRFHECEYDEAARAEILTIAGEEGDAAVASVSESAIELEVDFVASAAEPDEFISRLGDTSRITYGRLPASARPGELAVTLVLPDANGVVRSHPH
jgi:hypothetical protein